MIETDSLIVVMTPMSIDLSSPIITGIVMMSIDKPNPKNMIKSLFMIMMLQLTFNVIHDHLRSTQFRYSSLYSIDILPNYDDFYPSKACLVYWLDLAQNYDDHNPSEVCSTGSCIVDKLSHGSNTVSKANPALANTGYIRCYISCLCDQHRIYPVFGYPCT